MPESSPAPKGATTPSHCPPPWNGRLLPSAHRQDHAPDPGAPRFGSQPPLILRWGLAMVVFVLAAYATYVEATRVRADLGVPLILLTSFAASYVIANLMVWRTRP